MALTGRIGSGKTSIIEAIEKGFSNKSQRVEVIRHGEETATIFIKTDDGPLRGEWLSSNTPGTKIPSHGTNQLGTRYAYDFIQVDWERKGWPSYRVSLPQYLLFGVPLNEYYCWGQRHAKKV